MRATKVPSTIDEYIAAFPPDIQRRLWQMCATIKKSMPKAEERISYGMPAFAPAGSSKPIVWFGGFKNHVGFYPGAAAIAAFTEELSSYKGAKGTVQFPNDEPLPTALIARMVKHNLQQPPGKQMRRSSAA